MNVRQLAERLAAVEAEQARLRRRLEALARKLAASKSSP